MPTISRAFRCHPWRYSAGGNSPRYIVIHYTANDAPARNEANNVMYNNDGRQASAHFYSDGSGTIYQVMELTDTAYAVGAWDGATQLIGNRESVSIEVCNDGGRFTVDEIAELRWLVRRLMAQLGIDADHVVRHFDCHTGRKECPLYYSGFNNAEWETLRDTITREDVTMQVNDIMVYPVAYQELNGKQTNKKFWELVSWGGHYAAFCAAQMPILNNRIIELEKKVDALTAQVKAGNKTMSTILKKVS